MSVVNVEARNAANRFYRSFPMGYVTLEKFDDFIIHSMDVVDPLTDDTKDQAYKGFVADRSRARNLINRGGKVHPTPFKVVVLKEKRSVAGQEEKTMCYEIMPWADATIAEAASVPKRVKTFVSNKVSSTEAVEKTARDLMNRAAALDAPEEIIQPLREKATQLSLMKNRYQTWETEVLRVAAGLDRANQQLEADAKKQIAQAAAQLEEFMALPAPSEEIGGNP